jgi:hypothetical protein
MNPPVDTPPFVKVEAQTVLSINLKKMLDQLVADHNEWAASQGYSSRLSPEEWLGSMLPIFIHREYTAAHAEKPR